MKWLYVGLMNPTKQYQETRHNAGAIILSNLLSEFGNIKIGDKLDKKAKGFLGKQKQDQRENYFLFPTTYMNLSGVSVSYVAQKNKIENEKIIIFHDEIDLPCQEVRFKVGGGHRGHNGLRDIIDRLGSRDFKRIRIGVGRPANENFSVADYVLSKWHARERPEISSISKIMEENQLHWW